MKKFIILVLAISLLLTGCTQSHNAPTETISQEPELEFKHIVPEFDSLDDSSLLRYIDDNLYNELVEELNSSEYFVENVSSVYLSEEYLQELEYNSRKNIYFGYSLSELDEAFEGTRYVISLGDNNETIVEKFEEYNDDAYQRVIQNVVIGTGVILICVTVSVVTAGAGAPAVSLIFATAAKTGTTMALSAGALSGVTTAIITGLETQDMSKAMRDGLLAGSEAFKWGAIAGVIAGGATEGVKYAKATKILKGVNLNGLSTQQAAYIQMKSKYPVDIVKQFSNMDEYEVFLQADLKSKMINGKQALVRNFDLSFKSELPNGTMTTNLQRMTMGYAPIDPISGKAFQLHHVGQKADATLAILTEAEHQGNSAILHMVGKASEIDRNLFGLERVKFWKSLAASLN